MLAYRCMQDAIMMFERDKVENRYVFIIDEKKIYFLYRFSALTCYDEIYPEDYDWEKDSNDT